MTVEFRTDIASVTKQAGLALPPIENKTFHVAVTSTSVTAAVPAAWKDKYCDFEAESSDVFILFGTSGVVASDTAPSGGTVAGRIPQDQSRSWFVPGTAEFAYYAVKSKSATTATLRVLVSSF